MKKHAVTKNNAYDLTQVSRALNNTSASTVRPSGGSSYDLNRVNAAKSGQKPVSPRPVKG